jgi:hypothetical protein
MEVSIDKSIMLSNFLSREVEAKMQELFPFKFEHIDYGFKYMGYFLNLNDYNILYWMWLLKKVEDRISCWCHKWLSLGGRLVLLKSMFESILIYWLSLAHVPKGILDRIRKRCFSFLWSSQKQKEGILFFKWSLLAKPKERGGWGLKNIFWFG